MTVRFALLSLLCWLNIVILPINKYEWMLSEEPKMTLPIDGEAGFYPLFAVLPLVFLVPFVVLAKTKTEKSAKTIVIIVLLGIWLYKFHSSLI